MADFPHAYFGGRWVGQDQAALPVDSLALRYGLSVFEAVRLYAPEPGARPVPFLLAEHLARLAGSLSLMRFPDPGVDEVGEIIDELVERNQVRQDAYVRIAIFPGSADQLDESADPVLSVTVTAMARRRWLARDESMVLQVSSWQRGSPDVCPPGAKNISGYAGPRLALLAAREAGYDGCVLLNRHGRLCEAPMAALFLVHDGILRTPALDEDVLPSITRAWVLRAAVELGIAAEQTHLTTSDAHTADEAFLCGTGIEFGPVRSLDRRQCRHWPRMPITRRIIDHYFDEARAPHRPMVAGGAVPGYRTLSLTPPLVGSRAPFNGNLNGR